MNAITNSDRFSGLPRLVNERKGESMYTILFDEAEARGEIRSAIKIYREEMNLMPSEIINKIIVRFNLKKEEAEKYVEETLGLELV